MRLELSDSDLEVLRETILSRYLFNDRKGEIAKIMENVKDALQGIYGPIMTAVIFYHLGRSDAERTLKFVESMNVEMKLDELLRINWAIDDVDIIEDERIVIKVSNKNELDSIFIIEGGEGGSTRCFYIRGYIERIIDSLYKKKISRINVDECKDNDMLCIYEILFGDDK